MKMFSGKRFLGLGKKGSTFNSVIQSGYIAEVKVEENYTFFFKVKVHLAANVIFSVHPDYDSPIRDDVK